MRKIITGILLYMICSVNFVNGQVGSGANFLKIGIGPRQIGLGSAFTGVADDIYSIYWNPAGLGYVRNWEFSFMGERYFSDIYLSALSGVKQFRFLGSRKFTVGLSFLHLGMPDWDSMENRERTGEPMGSAANSVYTLSLAQRLDWLKLPGLHKRVSIGMNIKYLSSELAGVSTTGLAYDLGAYYKWEIWGKPFNVGLTVQNIGKSLTFIEEGSPLPLGFRTGVSYKLGECTSHQLLLASDIAKYKSSSWKLSMGAEYWFRSLIGVRSGYIFNADDLGDFSFGLSYRFGVMQSGTQIDGGYSYFNTLGNTFKGAYSLFSVSPEPFRLISPENEAPFCYGNPIEFKWEDAPGASVCDKIYYQLLIDTSLVRLKDAVSALKQNPLDTVQVFVTKITGELTSIETLPDFPDSICYWTVVAVDQEKHVRRADQIWQIILRKPDILIKELVLEAPEGSEDFLFGFDDPVKTKLKIILENKGLCDALDFKVILYDSLLCPLDFRQFHSVFEKKITEFPVDTLFGASTDTLYTTWGIAHDGLHKAYGIADYLDDVNEFNEMNNDNYLLATTGARGLVEIDGIAAPLRTKIYGDKERDSTIVTPEIRLTKIVSETSDIPLVPYLFFDVFSTRVKDDYYSEELGKPFPILQEIAKRMKMEEYKDLNLLLTGYIDPDTEYRSKEENVNLANARAEVVKEIIITEFGISPHRIQIIPPPDSVTAKYIQSHSSPAEISEIDRELISEENRRVDLAPEHGSGASEILFYPKKNQARPYFTEPITFYSIVEAPGGCSGWQLEIIKEQAQQKIPVIILPFQVSDERRMVDSLQWTGTDRLGNLVEVNRNYSFRMNFADKDGDWKNSAWKTFRLTADSIVNNRYVHLMQFDKHKPIYHSFQNSIQNIADKFVAELLMNGQGNSEDVSIDTTITSYILGFTCVIGREERLLELANNQRTMAILDSFKNEIRNNLVNRGIYNDDLYDKIMAQIDTTAHLHARDYIRTSNAAQWYKEPFLMLQPCCDKEVIYGTETPEGRNYNRRVEIVLSRKISGKDISPRIYTDKH